MPKTSIHSSTMPGSRRPDEHESDLQMPTLPVGRACEVAGPDGMMEKPSRSAWIWPGRAMAMLRACRGFEQYVADSSGKSHHLAWAVGSAGLLSAGLFLLMRRVKLFPWTDRGCAETPAFSTYDSVTGLPTKRLFMTLVGQALSRARKIRRHVAILMVELDHFAPDENRHGPPHGNLVYRVQAARLKSALRTTETVARLGDRSFAALIENIAERSDVEAVAAKMQATVSLPFILEGRELFLTSRIGIGLSSDMTDAAGLLDLATQAVTRAGTESYVVYGGPSHPTTQSPESLTGVPIQ
jgi:diguanylate cyclase (GGDEF)-like protein